MVEFSIDYIRSSLTGIICGRRSGTNESSGDVTGSVSVYEFRLRCRRMSRRRVGATNQSEAR